MQAFIDAEQIEQYQSERNTLLHQRIALTTILGALLFPVFSILDFMVAREHFVLFFIYRILCSAALIAIYFYNNKSELAHKFPFFSAFLAYFVSTLALSAMIVKLGGYETGYYMGLLLALVVCTTLLPLSIQQYLICVLITCLLYVVPVLLFCEMGPLSGIVFINNNFFLISGMIIILFLYYENNRSQALEFNMRTKKSNYAKTLSALAENLEDKVQRKTIEFETLEVKFQQLYENINDDIVLLDQQGTILHTNKRFAKLIEQNNKQTYSLSFLSCVHPEDRKHVDQALLIPLSRGENVTEISFRLQFPSQKTVSIECNASIIKKGSDNIGNQLLLRDISERIALKSELFASFQAEQYAQESIILALANLAEYRTAQAGKSLEKIREYSRILAEELTKSERYHSHITEEYIETLYLSSILHDIGKVGIPDTLLSKVSKLSEEEHEIIQQHVIFGGDTLKSIEAQTTGQNFLVMGKHIAYFHHERWDGKGYPQGLKGNEIPLSASIISLVDAYEAMTSPRSYRKAYSHKDACKIILQEKGKQFAPDIVDAFWIHEKIFEKIKLSE